MHLDKNSQEMLLGSKDNTCQCGPGSNSGGEAICAFSLLLVLIIALRVFLRVLQFSSLHKKQDFQISIRSGTSGSKSYLVDSTEIPLYLFIVFNFSRTNVTILTITLYCYNTCIKLSLL